MNKWFKFGTVGLLVFGAVAVLMSSVAFAQDDVQPTPENAFPHPMGRGFGRGMGNPAELEAVAGALGMTVDELTTQLWGGKTIADLAEEKGVDLAEIQATVQAAKEANMRAAIEQAVQDGTITQDHADWLLEGLEKGYMMRGFGFGHGFGGGFRGPGFKNFTPPENAPSLTPSGGA